MTTVTMPQLGESVTEGTILAWLKKPGDPVLLDDPLCEIETEKVTAELPSPFEGVMGEILVPEGETVNVGEPLCTVLESAVEAGAPPRAAGATAGGGWSGGPMAIPPDEAPVPAPNGAGAAVPRAAGPVVPRAAGPVVPRPARPAATSPESRERYYSPAVMRLATEHGVDLSAIKGTGVGGRVTRKDVEARLAQGTTVAAPAAAGAPVPRAAGARYDVVQLSATRRTIAENLKRSNLEAPQAWTMVEADVTPLVRLRERDRAEFQRREGVDLTLLPYFAVAVCETLREFPMLNARWEGEELRRYNAVDLGIAVAAETGLVVPVIHDAGDLNLAGMARRIADIVDRARQRKLRIEDIEGGTFTVNNTGSFGSIASKPIVNYPQVGIVTMERVVKRAVVVAGDAIAVRSMVNLCLSFDHRAMDGLEAGGFLAALKQRMETLGA
ncbi:MAG: 2-oxo acid dehydrogenase subunit E2 [Chloroflexi bacterium]|nr:2-oxo acid dehydrogenase subunit E2 [Chloroflexota bacterium]